LLRLQTISRGAGYVDTLFFLLKALARPVVAPADNHDVQPKKKTNKKDADRALLASRSILLKSIHESFLRTAQGQLLAAEYQEFQKTWTLPFVTGRLQLAEWMAGSPLMVHAYTCTCYPYDA
jgi:hypothetical protein